MFDIQKLTSTPVLSKEETLVNNLLEKRDTNIVISYSLVNVEDEKTDPNAFFEDLKPIITRVESDLSDRGLKINAYASRMVKNTLEDIITYLLVERKDEQVGLWLMGTIAEEKNVLCSVDENTSAFIMTLNFCECDVSIEGFTTTDSFKTLTVIQVPITFSGIINNVGDSASVKGIIEKAPLFRK